MLNKISKFILITNFALFLFSCSSSQKPIEEDEIVTTVVMEEAVVSSQAKIPRRKSKSKIWKLLHTQLDLQPNLEEAYMEAEELIFLSPYAMAQDSIVLDAKYLKVSEVNLCQNKVQWKFAKAQSSQKLEFHQTPFKLYVDLKSTYQPSDTLCLSIKYQVTPEQTPQGGSSAIRNRIGLYFIRPDSNNSDKPLQLWTQGEPESASYWFPTLDAPNQKSTLVMAINHTKENLCLSNGILQDSIEISEDELKHVWVQDKPYSPYLFMMAIGDFYKNHEKHKAKDLYYYVPKEYKTSAKALFGATPEILDFLSSQVGFDLPVDKYAQMIVHDFISGAMENQSAVTFSTYFLKSNRELLDDNIENTIVHEMFHHWFGNYATFESWVHINLSESFATLSSTLWQEYKYGMAAGQHQRYYDLWRYMRAMRTDDPPLVRYYYKKPGDVFDHISYPKGSVILYYIRDIIGVENFNMAMHKYLDANKYSTAETDDWREVIEEITGDDWEAFFHQWYYRSGIPELKVWQENIDSEKVIRLYVLNKDTSDAPNWEFKTQLKVYEKDSTWEKEIVVTDSFKTWDISYASKSPIVVFDGHHSLPASIERSYTQEYWLGLLSKSKHFEDQLNAIFALGDMERNFDINQAFIKLAKSKDDNISRYALEELHRKDLTPEDVTFFQSQLDNKTLNGKRRALIVDLLATPSSGQNKDWLIKSSQDLSYTVSASALAALDSIDLAYTLQFCIDSIDKAEGALYSKILQILSNQDSTVYFPLLDKQLYERSGSYAYIPITAMKNYASHISDSSTYKMSVDKISRKAVVDKSSRVREYAVSALYDLYGKERRSGNDDRAAYAKSSILDKILSQWEDQDRADVFRESLDWNIKP